MTDTEPLPPTASMTVAQMFQDAVTRQQAGEWQDAERLYRALLQTEPMHAEANHHLGRMILQQGHAALALPHLKQALKSRPKESLFWLSYIEALIQDGQPDAARQMLAQGRKFGLHGPAVDAMAARLAPASAGAATGPTPAELEHVRNLYNEGRFAELESAARGLVERFPGAGSAWKLLGLAQHGRGLSEPAEASMKTAVRLLPGDWQIHYVLGNLCVQKDQRSDAEGHFRRCLSIKPDHADAFCKLGHLLGNQSRLTESETCYRSALAINPELTIALGGLGNVLTLSGRVAEAEKSYRKMLQLIRNRAGAATPVPTPKSAPGVAPGAEMRGQDTQDRTDELAACCCVAYTLMIQGRANEADGFYREARAIGALPIEHEIQASLLLPPVYMSRDDISDWRARFAAGLKRLRAATERLDPAYLHMPSFYLAYQNQNNGELMRELNAVLREKVATESVHSDWVEQWTAPQLSERRIRVGFLSEFFGDGHTIGKLYEGLIGSLDKRRFEVLVIQPHQRASSTAPQGTSRGTSQGTPQGIELAGESHLRLPEDFESQRDMLVNARLDVLFFPDIGMSAFSYFLAGNRFAPVQVVAWGHPDTTGIDTVDYFVSADSIEPEHADAHYTERLVRLSRLPCFFQTPPVPKDIPDRQALGLPPTGTLYGCPQSLFKFHPDFDAVLAAIAEGDAEGRIILLEGPQPAWIAQLRARWTKTFPILLTKVLFLPRLPLAKFMALMSHMDVLLDPLHFGSGNTLYEAMVYGTPVVTWPGRFMRGRIVSGAYRQMAVPDAPVVQHIAAYAAMALALGRDPSRRQILREASIVAARRDLYEDMRAVREFEAFLEAAVMAAGRGEKLPPGWTPMSHTARDMIGDR